MARRGNQRGGHQGMGEQFERKEETRILQRLEERLTQLMKDRMDTITEVVAQKLGGLGDGNRGRSHGEYRAPSPRQEEEYRGPSRVVRFGGQKGSTRQHNHHGVSVKVETFDYLRYEEIKPLVDVESCSEELGEGIGHSEWPEGDPVYDDYDETFEETTEQLQEQPLSLDSETVDSVDGGNIEGETVLSSSPEFVDDNSDAEIRYVLNFIKGDSCNGVLDISSQRLVKRENVSPGSTIYSGALESWSGGFEGKGELNVLSKETSNQGKDTQGVAPQALRGAIAAAPFENTRDFVEFESLEFEEAHGSKGRLSEKHAYPRQQVVGDAETLVVLAMKERQERIFERGREKGTSKQGSAQRCRLVELGVVAGMSHASISSTAGSIFRFSFSYLPMLCPLEFSQSVMLDPRLGAMTLNMVEVSCGADVLAPERSMMLGYIETTGMMLVRELFDKMPGQDIVARDTVLNGVATVQPNEYGLPRAGPAEFLTEPRRSDLFDPGGKILNVIDVSYGGGMLGKVAVVRSGLVNKIGAIDGSGFYCINDEDIWHSSNSRSNSIQPEENDAGLGRMNDAIKSHMNDADKGQRNGADKGQSQGCMVGVYGGQWQGCMVSIVGEVDGVRFYCSSGGGIGHASNSRSNSSQPGENDADLAQINDTHKSLMVGADKDSRNDADKDQTGKMQSRESTGTKDSRLKSKPQIRESTGM